MGRSKEKRTQRNRQGKIRQQAAKHSIRNTPTQLPAASIPCKSHLQVLQAAYEDFRSAEDLVEWRRDLFRCELVDASVLQAAQELYREKTNNMVLGCLQQSLVRHMATGKRYNFFGNMLAAIMEHAGPELRVTPFRHDRRIQLKLPRCAQYSRQVASMPAPPSKSAGALGAALLRQFHTPPHQLTRTWSSNRGG